MKVGIVGAGKIGMAVCQLASRFASVVCLDVKPPFDLDYSKLTDADVTFIAVNTTSNDCYDTKNVVDSLAEAAKFGLSNIVILSTCPPSFFDLPQFVQHKENITYSPLFIRQGSIEQDIVEAEFVLVGSERRCENLFRFYRQIRKDYRFVELGFKEAAIVKMGINGFLTIKVVYANMIGDFCVSQGLDPDAVLDAIAASKSVNSHYFRYGYGFGGPCLPIDNRTLADEMGNEFHLHVDSENNRHMEFMVDELCRNGSGDKPFVFDGVGYKPGVPIITNSQQLRVAAALAWRGHTVLIRDCKAVCDLVRTAYPEMFLFEEVE